jgi:RNA polymerase sigma-70 factor (ECF subfamily)
MLASPPDTQSHLLLRLLDRSDGEAWEQFVRMYRPLVFRVAVRRGHQPHDAEDVVQAAFAAVVERLAEWHGRRGRGRFRPWLLAIARNIAVNQLCRQRPGAVGAGGEAWPEVMDSIAADQSQCAMEFDAEYRRELFRRAADRVRTDVTESTWQAFQLTQLDGISVAVAAQRLQMSHGAVYLARCRVMERLRQAVTMLEDSE